MLDERKIKILEALINDYIVTAEPISSRAIAKKYNFGISSATIRNEMSDLEEMGFILQPHASAGRVPSDKGYRLYVDNLMKYRELTDEEYNYLKDTITNNIDHIEYLMEETAKAISILTNYTTIVAESKLTKYVIKNLHLIAIDNKSILLTLITDNKSIKNHIINIYNNLNTEDLNKISYVLNCILKNLTIGEILNIDFENIIQNYNIDKNILKIIFDSIKKFINKENNTNIYTSGVNNILTFPEFSNIDKVKNIFKTLEEKEILATLLDKLDNNSNNIQIIIGSENILDEMKDFSIIKSSYKLVDKTLGYIGIFGPTRMNYMQSYSILNGICKTTNNILKNINKDTEHKKSEGGNIFGRRI